MGNYVTDSTELTLSIPQARLIQLAADLSTQTTLGDATVAGNITAAIESAESEIDGILESRMTVPVATPSKRLKMCARKLTIYYLSQRKQELSEHWEKQYDRETKWLERAKDGEIGIGAVTPDEHETVHTSADSYEIDGSDRPMVFGGGKIDELGSG